MTWKIYRMEQKIQLKDKLQLLVVPPRWNNGLRVPIHNNVENNNIMDKTIQHTNLTKTKNAGEIIAQERPWGGMYLSWNGQPAKVKGQS